MELRLLEKDKEEKKVSFMLRGATPAFANALRTAMLVELPVMAIEDVEIRKNSSIMYDEMVAHRLGLVPLTTDLKSYNIPEECKCEGAGCARCQVALTLKVKGPATVYAEDLKSKDESIKPVFPKLPIVKLLKNQSLELEAIAMLGRGKVHMKWSPCHAYYRQKPDIQISSEGEGFEKCVSACPVSVFEMKNGKAEIIRENLLNCHLCDACVKAVDPPLITVTPSGDFIFFVESWGQLEPKVIVSQSAKIISGQLDEFAQKIRSAS